MQLKRKVIITTGIISALVVVVGLFYLYRSFHPHTTVTRMVKDSDVRFKEEYYCEYLTVITAKSTLIRTAPSVETKWEEFHIWNDGIATELYENYVAPLHITVSGEVKDGKTTFLYEGYVTTPEGDTIPYREEKTFDYVFDPGSELFQ